MIVNIPISYKITGVRKTNTTQSSSRRAEVVSFELQELDTTDAPVVASWKDESSRAWKDRHVRMHDEMFIEPVTPERFLQPHISCDSELVSTKLFLDALKTGGTILSRTRSDKINRPFEDEYSSVVEENRTEKITEMRQLIANLFSVDGAIYRRTHCPKLCVKTDVRSMPDKDGDNFANCGGNVLKVVTDNYDGLTSYVEFIDIKDLSYATTRLKRLNSKVVRKEAWNELNTQLASHIVFDSDAHWPDSLPSVVQGHVTLLMRPIRSTTLERSSLPFLKAYCDVYECWQRLPDPDCLDDLEDALRAFAPHMKSAELETKDCELAIKIIDMINSRDVAFQAITDNSLRIR